MLLYFREVSYLCILSLSASNVLLILPVTTVAKILCVSHLHWTSEHTLFGDCRNLSGVSKGLWCIEWQRDGRNYLFSYPCCPPFKGPDSTKLVLTDVSKESWRTETMLPLDVVLEIKLQCFKIYLVTKLQKHMASFSE